MNKSNESIIDVYKALGDHTRYSILKLISSKGNRLCVTEIANNIGASQPVVSQHLKILKNAGIVDTDRIGNRIHYSIQPDILDNLQSEIKSLLKFTSDKCIKKECPKLYV